MTYSYKVPLRLLQKQPGISRVTVHLTPNWMSDLGQVNFTLKLALLSSSCDEVSGLSCSSKARRILPPMLVRGTAELEAGKKKPSAWRRGRGTYKTIHHPGTGSDSGCNGMWWDGMGECQGQNSSLFLEGGPFLAGGIQCQQLQRQVHANKILNTVHSVNEWMETISQGTAVSWHSTKTKVIIPQSICHTEEEKDVVVSHLSRLLWPPQHCWKHYLFSWKNWKCRW